MVVGTVATWLGIMGMGWMVLGSPGWGVLILGLAAGLGFASLRAAARLSQGSTGAPETPPKGIGDGGA